MAGCDGFEAARLVAARRRAGLTQVELAAAAGTTEATVNRAERGVYPPRISTIRRLAAALGVTWADLVPDPDAPTENHGNNRGNNRPPDGAGG